MAMIFERWAVSQKLFGTDGVRGVANLEPITAASALKLAQATVRVLGNQTSRPKVVIGRDTRASGELLESAIAAGLASCGAEVMLAGVVPTPAVAYLTPKYHASFGVVISASHNPFEDNGIKFFGPTGYKLSDESESAIECEFDRSGPWTLPTGKGVGRISRAEGSIEAYADFAVSTFPEYLSLRGVKIAVDAANGAAYQTTPLVLARLGAEIELHAATPDGFNINACCGSTHPESLSELVLKTGAAFGIAHDGDADRLLLCDEKGAPLDGDELLAIASVDLIRRNQLKRNTVVATVMSNFGLDDLLRQHHGNVLRTPVGDRFVVDALVQHELNLGGEQSGHIVFRDFTTTGDGLISALQIIAVMLRTGQPVSELRRVLNRYPQLLRNVAVREKKPFGEIGPVLAKLREAELLLNGRGRVMLRYSGTEPKARLLLEGPDTDELVKHADAIIEELVRSIGI
jgi:phosphoglucosamine mutase